MILRRVTVARTHWVAKLSLLGDKATRLPGKRRRSFSWRQLTPRDLSVEKETRQLAFWEEKA